MSAQQAIDFMSDNIAEVGTLMQTLSTRYEGIFDNLRGALGVTLEKSATIGDAARDAADIADAASASFRTHVPNQPATACSSGCAACCHLYVQVPPGVARVMADHIALHFAPAEQDALRERLRIAADAAAAAPEPRHLRMRCPLLGSDNRCTVYEVRPLSCRAFTSKSLARCQEVVFGDPASGLGVEQIAGHFRIHMEATSALEREARNRGFSGEQKGLALALLDEMATQNAQAG